MRGVVAKRLRKIARESGEKPTTYITDNHTGEIRCVGFRDYYKFLKIEYMRKDY